MTYLRLRPYSVLLRQCSAQTDLTQAAVFFQFMVAFLLQPDSGIQVHLGSLSWWGLQQNKECRSWQ